MASIRLECIEKVYPNGQVAVRDLDLEVAHGEFVVLVGPSGCGKTTTLRIVAGLESPTRGRVFLGDRDVTDLPPQARDLAMVFQSYALYPHKTVKQNLEFGLRLRQASPAVIAERIAKVAGILGVEPLLDRRPSQLSGGQRQRIALGRAIVREPQAFLLDEPLSNLDAKLRIQTRAELARMHRQLAATLLYVTHDQEEAMTLGDRIAVLREGRLQQLAAPLEAYRRPANTFVAGFIGSPAMNLFPCTLHNADGNLRLDSPWFSILIDADANVKIKSQEVQLGVRPQDILLTEPPEGNATARVDVVLPLGSELVIHLELLGQGERMHVTVVAPAETQLRMNDRVGLRFRPDRLHLFDATNGNRLN